MSNITKEAFLKQKISNFIIFIEKKIGKDNNIYKDFQTYSNDLNQFLQAMIQVSRLTNGTLTNENILKFLEIKGVNHKLCQEDIVIINRYFTMFVKVLEN